MYLPFISFCWRVMIYKMPGHSSVIHYAAASFPKGAKRVGGVSFQEIKEFHSPLQAPLL